MKDIKDLVVSGTAQYLRYIWSNSEKEAMYLT